MKIRYGLVLVTALGLGLTGCASGGGGSSAAAAAGITGSEGQPPRETDDTNQASEFLDAAAEAGDPQAAASLYRNALTAAEAAVAAGPNNPLAHRLAALASLGLEDYESAATYFDRAGELYPLYEFEDAQIREQTWIELYNEAMPLIAEAEYETAAALFENANAIYTDRPEAFITLGQLYAQLRQHDLALENLDLGLAVIEDATPDSVDPETLADWQEQAAEIPMLRAQVLSDAGRFEEAAAIFETMIADDPMNVEAARNLAATQLQMGDEAGAFATYEALLSNPSLGPVDLYQIGIGFYQGSDYARAAEAFAQGVEGNPMDRDGLEMWARSLQEDQAWADVPPVGDRWLELDPNSRNAMLIMAQAVNETGNSQRAAQLIQRVEDLDVMVDELQMLRYGNGGARVTGTVANLGLPQGSPVSLTFTFYTMDGSPMGTVTETVSIGGDGTANAFQVEFESSDTVGGYGYTLTTG